MATVEERMRILKMIEAGKISAEEGAKLLSALDKSRKTRRRATRYTSAEAGGEPARWVRIRVSDTSSGRTKVNMNIPLGLVNMGLMVGSRFVPEVADLDIDQLREAIKSGMPGKILEVMDDDGELVEIFVD